MGVISGVNSENCLSRSIGGTYKKNKNHRPLNRKRTTENYTMNSLPACNLSHISLLPTGGERNSLNITIELTKIASFQFINCNKQGMIFHKAFLYVNSP